MKLWFNTQKAEKKESSTKAPKLVGKELSDDLMSQISGGLGSDKGVCHTAST